MTGTERRPCDTPTSHAPVMAAEVVTLLDPGRGGLFVDCTVGAGGHGRALLEAGAGRLLGMDRDTEALPLARETLRPFADRVELVHADFRRFDAVLDARGVRAIDGGALADLGVSSMQLDGPRGFSFRRDEPLDMRMDRTTGPTAAELLRDVPEPELADVIYQYGEDRHARRIARSLVNSREREPIASTGQLADAVRRAVGRGGRWRIHPATRTFQALRIWVNRELEGLDAWIESVCRRLRTGARLAVLTFHSLEDRIIKQTFRRLEREGLNSASTSALRILTKRPLRPSEGERSRNPRARSAKLRAAERAA